MAILNVDISNMTVITIGFCSCLYISWICSAFRILVLKTSVFANVIVSIKFIRSWVSEDDVFWMEILGLKELFVDSQIGFLFLKII